MADGENITLFSLWLKALVRVSDFEPANQRARARKLAIRDNENVTFPSIVPFFDSRRAN
jgi:hypothetical protein